MPKEIVVASKEFWDEQNEEFIVYPEKDVTLILEHSLISISKWESKWHIPFYSEKNDKTKEQLIDYVRCMTINKVSDPLIYNFISQENMDQIANYIDDPMTATTFSGGDQNRGKKEVVTSEIIYYWMIQSNIPLECEKWHINRLLTLIRVCSIKNAPPKKAGKQKTLQRYAALNAARRQKHGN